MVTEKKPPLLICMEEDGKDLWKFINTENHSTLLMEIRNTEKKYLFRMLKHCNNLLEAKVAVNLFKYNIRVNKVEELEEVIRKDGKFYFVNQNAVDASQELYRGYEYIVRRKLEEEERKYGLSTEDCPFDDEPDEFTFIGCGGDNHEA